MYNVSPIDPRAGGARTFRHDSVPKSNDALSNRKKLGMGQVMGQVFVV